MKKTYFTILILILIICLLFGTVCFKPNIHTATHEELQEINGIGEVLSNRISLYLDLNKNATIEDLDCIDGIGDKTIEKIKRKFGD